MAQASVERENGLPISYACNKGFTQQRNLTLLFQYEFAVTDPEEDIGAEVIIQLLPALEYYILYYVAEAAGVLSCDIENQNILGDGQTQNNGALQVVGVSNADPDEWKSNITCTALRELEPNLVCVPLQGIMMARYVGLEENQNQVEQWLADHIESVINGPQVLRNGVEKAQFVASRVISPGPSVGANVDPTNDNRTRSSSVVPATLGGGAALGLVVGLVSAVFLARRRRRALNQRSEVIPEIPVDDKVVIMPPVDTSRSDTDMAEHDVENPTKKAYPDAEVPSVDNPLALHTVRTSPTVSETIDGSLIPPEANVGRETVASDDASKPTPPSDGNIKPQADASSPGSSKPPIPMVPKPPSSPTPASSKPPPSPKHPGRPGRPATPPPSTLQKKRRRKKKRKKKKALVRVNSREKVNEMETITEAAEEEIGDNSSDYSWYSTSDSCGSSREPSPMRLEDLSDFNQEDTGQPSNEGGGVGSKPPAAEAETSDGAKALPDTAKSQKVDSVEDVVEKKDDDEDNDDDTRGTGGDDNDDDTKGTTGDGSATTTSRATNDDTEGSEPPIPAHWV